jgi:uncharacterized protein YjbI with pentapeptide repeats
LSRGVRWIAALAVDLGGAFACGALAWHFGLPLWRTAAGSGNRITLAIGVTTVVAAALLVPLGSWALAQAGAESAPPDRAGFAASFDRAVAQVGDQNAASVRVAGVAAVVRLACDWPAKRQDCVEYLCRYLRLPYEPDSAAPGERQVRLAIIESLRANLAPGSAAGWRGLRFDFSGAVFDQGSLDGSHFVEGSVSFSGCRFVAAGLSVRDAIFWDCGLDCSGVMIDGDASLDFDGSQFRRARTNFTEITLVSGRLSLRRTYWHGGAHDFDRMRLRGGSVLLDNATFEPSEQLTDWDRASMLSFRNCGLETGTLSFRDARFEYETADEPRRRRPASPGAARRAVWPVTLAFADCKLGGATIDFGKTRFDAGRVGLGLDATAGAVLFRAAQFAGGHVSFRSSRLDNCLLDFSHAIFSADGETIDPPANGAYCQKWMIPIMAARAGAAREEADDVTFSMLPYPEGSQSLDFTDVSLSHVRLEFEHLRADGGIIDFKGAFLDEADLCFARSRFGGLVIVLWNARIRGGQMRLDRSAAPVILTDNYALTHSDLSVVAIEPLHSGHDGSIEQVAGLRQITPWAVGISSMD